MAEREGGEEAEVWPAEEVRGGMALGDWRGLEGGDVDDGGAIWMIAVGWMPCEGLEASRIGC